MLAAGQSLRITGVDRAEIDPTSYLQSPGALVNVDFRGGIDICALPFDDGSFDAVTSQFGIEYAPLDVAAAEAARVLSPGGQLQFLMHCNDSEVVAPAVARRTEMDAILATDGVLESLRGWIAGSVFQPDLERAGQAHLERGNTTEGISGQIFAGINQAIESMSRGDKRAAAELCETMILRLSADRDRLQALQDAALARQDIDALVASLSELGIEDVEAHELRANEGHDDEFVIGWLLRGQKA